MQGNESLIKCNQNINSLGFYQKNQEFTSKSISTRVIKQSQVRLDGVEIMTHKKKVTHSVPCLFLQANEGARNGEKLIIYLHANAENIFNVHSFCNLLRSYFQINVLSPEYPGYSIYTNSEPSEKTIINDLKSVLKYLINFMKFDTKDIILIGRSLGTSFALEVCRYFFLHSCILIAPFLSLKRIVEDRFGKICSLMIKNKFNNKEKISEV